MTVETTKKFLTKYQEWIELTGDEVTVGLTPSLLKELEEIVYVELPKVGAPVCREECVVVLETTKAAIDLYSPLSGVISQINETLKERPSLINQDPTKRGWLYKIKISDTLQIDTLIEN